MASVLLVDDDRALVAMLTLAFEDAGHSVRAAYDGVQALEAHRQSKADCIVCDINLPRLDGISVCRQLRAESDEVALILLTSRDGEIDQVLGLDLGADDYVTKPFRVRVLLARVGALVRRTSGHSGDENKSQELRAGELALDLARLEVRLRGELVQCTMTEVRLLEALCRRPGIVLTREQLLEHARGDEPPVGARIVDAYVRRLRRKFQQIDRDFEAIETVVGAGYRWSDRER